MKWGTGLGWVVGCNSISWHQIMFVFILDKIDQDKEGNSDLRGGGVTVNWEKREEYSKEKRSRRNAKIGGAT